MNISVNILYQKGFYFELNICRSLNGRSIEITLTVSLMKVFMNKSHVFKTKSNSKFSLKFRKNKDNKIQPFDNFLSGWYSSGSFHLSKCFLVQYRHFINLQKEIIQTKKNIVSWDMKIYICRCHCEL